MSIRIALRARVEPAVWPADALTDVTFHLVLTNEGDQEVAIYPAAAKLADVASMAGAGIAWQLRFSGAEGPVHQQELRDWHGPPGEPPSANAVKQSCELRLAPSRTSEVTLPACFVPNALLGAHHLDPAVLDPKRMDGIADFDPDRPWPAGYARPTPLHRRIPLPRASLLLYGRSAAMVGPEMTARPDFVRGRFSSVVAFFVAPGEYTLDAAYLQHSWMDLGEKLTAESPRVSIRVSGSRS